MILEPDWLKVVAKDARLSAKEILDIYGVSESTLERSIKSGRIPEPDLCRTFGSVVKRLWSAGLIRSHIKSMKQEPSILRVNDVIERTRLGKSTIMRAVKEGRFPQPFKLFEGGRAIGFYEKDVNEWINSRSKSWNAK